MWGCDGIAEGECIGSASSGVENNRISRTSFERELGRASDGGRLIKDHLDGDNVSELVHAISGR